MLAGLYRAEGVGKGGRLRDFRRLGNGGSNGQPGSGRIAVDVKTINFANTQARLELVATSEPRRRETSFVHSSGNGSEQF